MFGEHLHLICFGSCYLAAFVCELLRLVYRGPGRRGLTLALAGLGLGLHTLFLVARGLMVTHGLPIRTLFESLVLFAWLMAVVYLYLTLRHHPWAVGLFVLPVVLGVLLVAGSGLAQGRRPDAAVHSFWAAVHGLVLLAGSAAVTVAFVSALMYLVQVHRLKAKVQPLAGLYLPSLERLEQFNGRLVSVGFPLLTAGLVIGLMLNLHSPGRPSPLMGWHDPKVIATLAACAIFGLLLHVRYNPGFRGRKVAYLTVVAFVFMLFALFGADLLLGTAHPGLEGGA